MPAHLSEAQLEQARIRLGHSRAATRMQDFLVLKRTIVRQKAPDIKLSTKDPHFTGAVWDFYKVNGVYYNPFGAAREKKEGYRTEKIASNGPADTVTQRSWKTLVEVKGQRPRNVSLVGYSRDDLHALLLLDNESLPKPALSDVAMWLFREKDISKIINKARRPSDKMKALHEATIEALGLTKQDLTLFDTSLSDEEFTADKPPDVQKILPQTAPESPIKNIADLAKRTLVPQAKLNTWINTIKRKKQAIFYGPPGTSKTFIAKQIAIYLASQDDGFHEIIQFHPSFSYEEFMEGIRPRIDEKSRLLYEPSDGTFLQFCEEAGEHSGRCVLVIDEFNRANLSQVLGELFYLLEYRGEQIPLPISGDSFEVPSNVHLLCTMNTADRSIAIIDYALRRRFAFIRMEPDYDLLSKYHAQNTKLEIDWLIKLLKEINATIGEPDYHVGHSFFLSKTLDEDFESIWTTEIEPYLEEFFFESLDKVDAFRYDKITGRIPF